MKMRNACISMLTTAVLVSGLITGGAVAAETEKLNSEQIITEIEKQLQLSKDQWEKLKPILEEKTAELSKSMGESVDMGFVELEKLSEQLEMMSRDAENKFNEIVTSEEAQRLKEYLAEIDEEAVAQTRDTMIAELNELLALTEQQAQKIEPVLEETFNQLSTMILGLAEEGTRNWNDFKSDFEKLTRDLYDRVKSTLDDEQMEKLEKYNEKQEEKIERVLFRV